VLHPTFRNPRRNIENPVNGFRMKTDGWGIFALRAFVNKRDGSKEKLEHTIVLKRTPSTGVSD
jgi:transcription initiation factor IIF auxiliary subunit